MRLFVLALLLSPGAALACSMIPSSPNLGLPGRAAGPDAVFTGSGEAHLLGADEMPIDVTRTPYTVEGEGEAGALLVPVAPLAPGVYHVAPCDYGVACEATITEGAGDPGVPPEAPVLTFEPIRIATGQNSDCGPTVPGTNVGVESGAHVVVFAAAPVDTLADAELLGFARPEDGEPGRWITQHEGDVFAAAIDAEGELSEWTGPHAIAPGGCSTSGGAPLGFAALLAFAAVGRRARR
ncbi:MAG: hypothetical protein V4850_02940 [Myxococcota bacterium]